MILIFVHVLFNFGMILWLLCWVSSRSDAKWLESCYYWQYQYAGLADVTVC